MNRQSTVAAPKVNPLSDVDFDVNAPNGWYRYTYLRTVYSCGLRQSEALHIRLGGTGPDRFQPYGNHWAGRWTSTVGRLTKRTSAS